MGAGEREGVRGERRRLAKTGGHMKYHETDDGEQPPVADWQRTYRRIKDLDALARAERGDEQPPGRGDEDAR